MAATTDKELSTLEWIEESSYQTLLQKWRQAPLGDPMFVGELGEHYSKIMAEKKKALTNNEQVRASKNIGW